MSCKHEWCSSSVSLWCLSDCVVVISCRHVWCSSSVSFLCLSVCLVDISVDIIVELLVFLMCVCLLVTA